MSLVTHAKNRANHRMHDVLNRNAFAVTQHATLYHFHGLRRFGEKRSHSETKTLTRAFVIHFHLDTDRGDFAADSKWRVRSCFCDLVGIVFELSLRFYELVAADIPFLFFFWEVRVFCFSTESLFFTCRLSTCTTFLRHVPSAHGHLLVERAREVTWSGDTRTTGASECRQSSDSCHLLGDLLSVS